MVISSRGATRVEPPVVSSGDALTLFDAAASDPSLRSEVLIRGAFLAQLLGLRRRAATGADGAGARNRHEASAAAAATVRARQGCWSGYRRQTT